MHLKSLLHSSIKENHIVRKSLISLSFYKSNSTLSILPNLDCGRYTRRIIYGYGINQIQLFSTGSIKKDKPQNLNDEAAYHKTADQTLEQIIDLLSPLDDSTCGDTDVNLSQGVLNISFSPSSISQGNNNMFWVINKQTPNRQLWWSSPISGPRRYEWMPDTKEEEENLDPNSLQVQLPIEHLQQHYPHDLIESWKYNRNISFSPNTSTSSTASSATAIEGSIDKHRSSSSSIDIRHSMSTTTKNTNTLLFQLHKEILQVTGVDLLQHVLTTKS